MSSHRADRIEKPEYFSLSPLRMGRGNRTPYVIGFDSEAHSCGLIDKALRTAKTGKHRRCAENGIPFLFQFAHPDGRVDLIDVPLPDKDENIALWTFIWYLEKLPKDRDLEYVIFGYNLAYEYTQLYRSLPRECVTSDQFKVLDYDGKWTLHALNAKRYTFAVNWTASHTRIRVIDGMAFVQGGLDDAGEMLGLGRKYRGGTLIFDRSNAHDETMRIYAETDARITQRLGAWIMSQHERMDVRTTISAPQFACNVYRRRYLNDTIAMVDGELEQAGLEAYHGGKNGFYLDRPRVLKNMWHIDIRSAYPEAMRQLPDPQRSTWTYHDGYVSGLHAIWRVKGRYTRCRYRGLMGHDDWPTSGWLETTVTSYELDYAIRHGEISVVECTGWSLDGPSDGSLAEYVDTFYDQKSKAQTDGERLLAKLLLNSLYGKFFQKTPNGAVGAVDLETGIYITTDESEEYDYRAGGLYHPPIAALITGFVRAKVHGMEHDYDSVMTSTDGIFSHEAPPDHLLGRGLGQLSAAQGTLRIWRERLYIFEPDDGSERSYALHGFQGRVDDLIHVPMMTGNIYHYMADRMVTLRMAHQTIAGGRYSPGEFMTEPRSLSLQTRAPP